MSRLSSDLYILHGIFFEGDTFKFYNNNNDNTEMKKMNYNSLNYTHRFNLFNDNDDDNNNNGNRMAVILDDCVGLFACLRVFMQFMHSMSFALFLSQSLRC